ncbi:hypothetical protein ACFV0F_43925, partial [Streptomyces bottropensis]
AGEDELLVRWLNGGPGTREGVEAYFRHCQEQLETDVQPGQTAKGEFPTTLKSAEGIKLNITSFNRTAGY